MTQLLWVSEAEALGLHDRSIALAGGAPGLRDAGLLASALARGALDRGQAAGHLRGHAAPGP